MEFNYVETEVDQGYRYRPCIPVTFTHQGKSIFIAPALVDTGADLTILPIEIAHTLHIQLDDSQRLRVACAGGGILVALPSSKKITYTITKEKFRPISLSGIIYFVESEQLVLLGHYQCLEYFDLTFQGPERKLSILRRFKQ